MHLQLVRRRAETTDTRGSMTAVTTELTTERTARDERAPRLSPRRERTRERLLDAAFEKFAEHGIHGTSIEAVCEAAGFTRGAFYSNFETKDELMLALTERVAGEKIDEVAERVAVLQERGEDLEPGALVRQLLDVAFDKKQGILLTSEIRTRAMRDPRLAETYVAWQTGMVERIGSFIEELALAYTVYSFQSFHASGGFSGVYVGTRPGWEERVLDALTVEHAKLALEGLPADELEHTKQQVKGQVMLSLESTSARLYRLAGLALCDEPYQSLDEILARIDSVTAVRG